MAILNNVDQDTISRILIIAKFLHDHETDLFDLNQQYDSASGLKNRLEALPKGGQDALNELGGLGGMTVGELNDIAWAITSGAGVQNIVTNARSALSAVRKVS